MYNIGSTIEPRFLPSPQGTFIIRYTEPGHCQKNQMNWATMVVQELILRFPCWMITMDGWTEFTHPFN